MRGVSRPTVASGATLAGTGTVAGAVAVSNGGTLSPGDAGAGTLNTGALTLNSTSNLDFILGTSRDSVAVTGNLTLDGDFAIDVNGTGPWSMCVSTTSAGCARAARTDAACR